MAFEAIERLKLEYTDKYVTVTGGLPEQARFEGVVGRVKTVNMSGHALVEFVGYHNNPAWHDIPVAALKVVDKPPEPEPAAKKAKPKPKATAKPGAAPKPGAPSAADVLAAARGAAKKPADKPAAVGGKAKKTSPSVGKSTADILAAARGGAAASPSEANPADENPEAAGKKTSPSVALSTADVLAAARGKKTSPATPMKPATEDSPPKKKPGGALSTADILAAARGAKQPAADPETKPSALDTLEAAGDKIAEGPRKLTAADIRDIGLGKLSVRREQPIATTPREKADRPEAGDAKPAALPDKVDHSHYTAADIRDLGTRR